MATLGDIIRVYVKPSLDGKLIIRKKGSIQTSARLARRKEAVAEAGRAGLIAKAAHDELVKEGVCPIKRVYKAGVGYEERPVCPINLMKSALREKMKTVK
ncbi:MAG: hypothetical protein QW734_03730 [Candidatus Bathyarchaeia archaeon]